MKYLTTLLLAAVSLAAPSLHAQGGYPSKPIRLVVPFPADGATDIFARAGTPQQFASMLVTDRAKWKKIIVDRKITSE